MKALVGAIAALALGAAGWYGYAKYSHAEQLRTAREPVLRSLKDPGSAQFRDERLYGNVLCGEINSKNAMGGYVGFARFITTPTKYVIEGGSFEAWADDGNEALIAGIEAQTETLRGLNVSEPQLLPAERAALLAKVGESARFEHLWRTRCHASATKDLPGLKLIP